MNTNFQYLRQALEKLKTDRIIYEEEYELFKNRLTKLEEQEGFSMTHPFRCNDSIGKSLYILMHSLANKCKQKLMENNTSNEN